MRADAASASNEATALVGNLGRPAVVPLSMTRVSYALTADIAAAPARCSATL